MKNVAKIEIVLHDPYSNALWGGVWLHLKIEDLIYGEPVKFKFFC